MRLEDICVANEQATEDQLGMRRRTRAEHKAIWRMVCAGYTSQRISEVLRLNGFPLRSASSVRNYCIREQILPGLPMPPFRRPDPPPDDPRASYSAEYKLNDLQVASVRLTTLPWGPATNPSDGHERRFMSEWLGRHGFGEKAPPAGSHAQERASSRGN